MDDDDISVADQIEAQRSSLNVIRLIAAGDIASLVQHLATLDEFEMGHMITALGVWAHVGVVASATVHGLSFEEQLDLIEAASVDAIKDGSE